MRGAETGDAETGEREQRNAAAGAGGRRSLGRTAYYEFTCGT